MAEYNWPYPDEFGQTETVDMAEHERGKWEIVTVH